MARKNGFVAVTEVNIELFCFLCLMFDSGRGKFGNQGFTNLSNLQTAINRHGDDSKVHKEKDLSFRMLGTRTVRASFYNAEKAEIEAHNKKVQ